ncbi:hypothetical protein BV898_19867, partial [Hypsibius exemplaris]
MLNLSIHFNSTNSTNLTDYSTLGNCKWTGPPRQWFILNAIGLMPPLLTILCNACNLVVFRAWHKKEPYVLFHVHLAFSSLMYGGVTVLAPLGRLIRPRLPIQWMQGVAMQAGMVAHFLCFFSAAVISTDRWLSVEFPRFYQVHATKPKILRVIAGICGITLVCTIPGVIVWNKCLVFFCFRAPAFLCEDRAIDLHVVIKGPFFIGALFLGQARIVMIAAQIAIRVVRQRRTIVSLPIVDQAGHPATPPPVTGLVWSTLLPGMAIVGASLMSNIPQFVTSANKILRRMTFLEGDTSFMLVFVFFQHVASPFIYILFFRSYRNALKRMLRDLLR